MSNKKRQKSQPGNERKKKPWQLFARPSRADRWRFRPAVEVLEDRTMLNAVSWIGSSGNWNDPTQWSGGAVPTASDSVTIPSGATVTISDTEAAGSLTNSGTVDQTSTGNLSIGGGGLANQGGAVFDLQNTNFTVAGTFTNAGTFQAQLGTAGNLTLGTLVEQGGTILPVRPTASCGAW